MKSIEYIPNEYENNKLNWLSKHSVEIFMAVISFFVSLMIAFVVWEANLLLEMNDQLIKNTVNIQHINKAVNNAGESDRTLREIAVDNNEKIIENNKKIGILEERTKMRYEE